MIINEIIEYQLQQVFGFEYLRECLELRIQLIKKDYATKNEYERNEVDILYYQTKSSINKVSKQITEKKQEVKDLFTIYFQELKEQKTKKNKYKDGADNLLDNE
jgi:hypothetical protein